MAWGGPSDTRDALDRLQEVLELRIEDGRLDRDLVRPVLLVSAKARYEANAEWYPTRAVEILVATLGEDAVRLCEACMVPRARVEDGYIVYQTGAVGLDEIARLDEQARGRSPAARTAVWMDEHRGGVSLRIVDISTARVVFAQNFDPNLVEDKNTRRVYRLSEELERRNKGNSLSQSFVDMTVGFPAGHFSIDWTDQWGKRNGAFSGFSVTLFDPVFGVGAVHYGRVPFLNMLFGAKVVFSLPTAFTRAISDTDFELIDPMITGIGVIRVPFGRSNYGGAVTLSTNGQVGIGISLMNVSILPVFF